MISWDLNAATLSFIVVQVVATIIYLVKTNTVATAAHEKAERAEKRIDEAHEKVALMQANISMLREQVAKDYPDHDALENMEERIIEEIRRINKRIDEFLDRRHGQAS